MLQGAPPPLPGRVHALQVGCACLRALLTRADLNIDGCDAVGLLLHTPAPNGRCTENISKWRIRRRLILKSSCSKAGWLSKVAGTSRTSYAARRFTQPHNTNSYRRFKTLGLAHLHLHLTFSLTLSHTFSLTLAHTFSHSRSHPLPRSRSHSLSFYPQKDKELETEVGGAVKQRQAVLLRRSNHEKDERVAGHDALLKRDCRRTLQVQMACEKKEVNKALGNYLCSMGDANGLGLPLS